MASAAHRGCTRAGADGATSTRAIEVSDARMRSDGTSRSPWYRRHRHPPRQPRPFQFTASMLHRL